jgi:hypothetical protein
MLKSPANTQTIGSKLDNQLKKFHFQELDWLVYFPSQGNKGKYCTYTVTLRERKKGTSPGETQTSLGELLEKKEFDQNYPHTVGFYKDFSGEGADFKPQYLEIRIIRTAEEFWLFLNSLDI